MLALVASCSLGAALFAAPMRHGRMLSETPIGKYAPTTDVKDHANIDLDQKTLEKAFGTLTTTGTPTYDFAAVKTAFQGAGYSKATATCTLTNALTAAVAAGDLAVYTGVGNGRDTTSTQQMSGEVTAAASIGDTSISFKPQVVANAETNRVLTSAVVGTKTGVNGAVTDHGTCSAVTYASGRSLAGFSTGAKKKMYGPAGTPAAPTDCPAKKAGTVYANGCPYTSYKPYYDYYCLQTTSSCYAKGDYVNQQVLAAADKGATGTDNFAIDFATGTGAEATLRKDFLKKTSKFAGAWMYAIREFEDAIDDCALEDLTAQAWSDGAVHAWDEGVAFYVGSQVTSNYFYDPTSGLEKSPPNDHYLAYTLGNKRCQNFKTCGRDGDAVAGEAYINFELWKAFGDGRDAILTGNCAGAVPVKNLVVQLMTVPLVQGSLRYSWYCRNGATCTAKAIGEFAAFAGAVLPQVHACDAAAATTIATAANPSSYTCSSSSSCSGSNNDVFAVKAAFESCYEKMGLTCKLVGGLYDKDVPAYEAGMSPCSDASTAASDALSTGAIAGIAVGAGAAVILLLVLICVICKERSGTPLFTPLVTGQKKGAAA